MAIKDLAVSYNGSSNADTALRLAVQMCKKYDSALTGVYASAPVHFEGPIERWVPDTVIKSLRSAEGEVAGSIETTFRERVSAGKFKGEVEWLHLEGPPNEVLTRAARYYDLMLMGQFSEAEDKRMQIRAEEIVSRTGKPLLVVPNGYENHKFEEYAVVAWDGSRPAARALADAMQILETKKKLDVVTISKSDKETQRQDDNGPDIVKHLQRHGVEARRIDLTATREGVGPTILSYCEETNPDILVVGAYGHSALRGDLFGGVTRHIMRHMNVPVLMAH